MKNTTLFIVVSVFFLVSSCLPSLHPIVSEENRVIDDRVIGEWQDKEDESIWKFERASNFLIGAKEIPIDDDWLPMDIEGTSSFAKETIKQLTDYKESDLIIKKEEVLPYYILTHQEKGVASTKVILKVTLTEIGGNLFMDIAPFDSGLLTFRFSSNYLKGHTFAKVDFNGGKVIITSFNSMYIEELIEQQAIQLKHEIVEGEMVLTASTTELRAFINQYGQNPKLYEDSEELITL